VGDSTKSKSKSAGTALEDDLGHVRAKPVAFKDGFYSCSRPSRYLLMLTSSGDGDLGKKKGRQFPDGLYGLGCLPGLEAIRLGEADASPSWQVGHQ
jgi:hypothetical protein